MDKIKDKTILNIIRKIAREHNMSSREVSNLYSTYFKSIKTIVGTIEVKGQSEDIVDLAKTNFNLPGFGKLYMNKNKVKLINKRLDERDDSI